LDKLPRQIYSGEWNTGHVQGIAVDTERGYVYYSFTTALVKTDLEGNLVGTVTGLLGHLGCITLNPDDGRVYGSLEYKNDQIGKGILKQLGSDYQIVDGFYLVSFEVDKINRQGLDAERDGIMKAAYLKEVTEDFSAVENGLRHRWGCSGIDGTAYGPEFGKQKGKKYITVAYGIYSDLERHDNDCQVILQYDPEELRATELPLSQGNMHRSGPAHYAGKYFAYTGNTNWGVQNLEYDPYTGNWYMAVYKGHKPHFPNFPFYVIDGSVPPVEKTIPGTDRKGLMLSLLPSGLYDEKSGIWGYSFEYGQTGFAALGDGKYYVSHDGKNENGWFSSVKLYIFDDYSREHPFKLLVP